MSTSSRRDFLKAATLASLAGVSSNWAGSLYAAPKDEARQMQFGLVTYMWGAKWDLPTLLANCEKAKALGVELRTTHAHGVERSLSPAERKDVKKRFADSPVTNVGIGSNERFDNPDPAVVKKAIEATKEFIRLSQDVGGSGVKVKPDRFHKDVPREKTIEQIGRSLNLLGKYGTDYNQQIRLEVHGGCKELPVIRQILDVADHPNVAICWNSNPADLQGAGLEKNLDLVVDRFGETCHIHRLDSKTYPFAKLIELLHAADYTGWMLLEEGKVPKDPASALIEQRKLFDEILAATASER